MKTVKFGQWEIITTTQAAALGDVIFPKQTHGNVIIDALECIPGVTQADGIFTDNPKYSIGINTADCLPLVLLANTKAVALHVSRKTLIRGLVENIPVIMSPQEIKHIYIGPHICEKHFGFEYAGDEIQEFMNKFPTSYAEQGRVIYLSLVNAVQQYFDQWGIKNIPVHADNRCTFEDENLSSYRRTGKASPGIGTIVQRAS